MAELYLFDMNDNPITVLSEDTGLVEAIVRDELNAIADEPFKFSIRSDSELAKYVVEENKVVFRDYEGDLRLVVIKEIDDAHTIQDGPITVASCEPEVLELYETFVLDRRFVDSKAQPALNAALANTGWEGTVEVELGLATTNFYRIPAIEAVWKIIEVWGGEFKDVVELNEKNEITKRHIRILQRRGRDTGERFEIDHNIKEIGRTILSYPVTAMYGWGASLEIEDEEGEHTGGYTRYIDFGEVEWKKSAGDPVDKPKGQLWVGDPDAFAKYRRYRDGKWIHRFGEFSNQNYEDPADLLWATWEELQIKQHPEINYRLSVQLFKNSDIQLGDSATAVDRYFSRPIEIQTRIIALEYDLLEIEDSMEVEMGQFLNIGDDRIEELEKEVESIKKRPNQQVTEDSFPNVRPKKPVNVEATGGFEVIQLYWDFDYAVYVKHYEVYGSEIADFTPGPGNLLWRGPVSGFSHHVGTDKTWYYYVRAVNYQGVGSEWSERVHASTERLVSDDILFGEITADHLKDGLDIAEKLHQNTIDRINQGPLKEIVYTQEQIDSVRTSLSNRLDTEIGNVVSNITDMGSTVSRLTNKADALERELSLLLLDFDDLSGDMTSISKDVADFKLRTDGLEAEVSRIEKDLDGRVSANSNQIEINAKAIEAKLSSIDYERDLAGILESIEQNELDIKATAKGLDLRVTKDEYNAGINDMTDKITSTNAQLEIISGHISAKADKTELQNYVDKTVYNSQVGELTTSISGITGRVQNVETELDSATRNISSALSQIGELKVTASGITQSVTELRKSFDDLEIGGRNLILGSDLSKIPIGWTTRNYGTISIDSSNKYDGYNSLKVVSNVVGTQAIDLQMRHDYPLAKGDKRVFSAYMKASKSSTFYVRTGFSSKYTSQTVGTNWTKVILPLDTTTMTSSYESTSNIFGHFKEPITFYMAKPKVEKGDKATDWTLAPEDIDTELSSLSGSIETLAGQVSLKASQTSVTSLSNSLTSLQSEVKLIPDQISLAVSEGINKLEIGGRNLITLDSVWVGNGQAHGHRFVLKKTGSANPYVRIPHTLFENNTDYVITFKARKISGTVHSMAGHVEAIAVTSSTIILRDGVEIARGRSWSTGDRNNYPDDTKVHKYEIRFKTSSDVSAGTTPHWYIQPNRAAYGENYEMEIWDWQLEKGTKATDWNPAPEDIERANSNLYVITGTQHIFAARQATRSRVRSDSIYLKSHGNISELLSIRIQFFDTLDGGSALGTVTHNFANDGHADMAIPVPKGAKYIEPVVVTLSMDTAGDAVDTLFDAKIKIEEGNVPTAYIPSDADSAGLDRVVSFINLSTEGVRIGGNFVHISGQTLIDDAVIGTAAIKNLAVTNAKLGNLAVNTAKIADAAITTAKIANLAVDTAKIANAAITNAKIASLSVDKLTGSLATFVRNNFNGVSSQVQISGLGLETYSGSSLTSRLDGSGHRFFRSGINIGNIGTGSWLGDDNYRGLSFQLENSADYMAWSFRETSSSATYTTMLAWHKRGTKVRKGFTFYDNVEIQRGHNLYVSRFLTNNSSSGPRGMGLMNFTWDGVDGVFIGREPDSGKRGGGLYVNNGSAVLVDHENAYIKVSNDSTGNYVQSMDIYNRTYTATSQMVRVTSSGTLGRSTSSRRYKLLEEAITLSYAEKLLELNAKSWYDKRAVEEYAHTLETGEETEGLEVTRIGGLIAEDVHDIGLGMYVNYDDKGRPDGLHDNLWTLLIPITRKVRTDIEDIRTELQLVKNENAILKYKVKTLEERLA